MSRKDNNRGFSGLSNLTSDIHTTPQTQPRPHGRSETEQSTKKENPTSAPVTKPEPKMEATTPCEKDNNRGFSGLSNLTSDIHATTQTQAQRKTSSSKPKPKTTSSPSPIKPVASGKSGESSSNNWVFVIIGILLVIWLINSGDQSSNSSSYKQSSPSQNYSHPKATSAPVAQIPSTSQKTGLQYIKPSVGTNNLLSVEEIRWCLWQSIRIEAIREIINSYTDINAFNRIVNDYNSRCGSYRYRQGAQARAERDVETYRSQIVTDVLNESFHLSRSYPPERQALNSYQPSLSSAQTSDVTNSNARNPLSQRHSNRVANNPIRTNINQEAIPSQQIKFDRYKKKTQQPNRELVIETQKILTELGYDLGAIDGQFGQRTAMAIRSFQYQYGINQDGLVSKNLVYLLKKAKSLLQKSTNQQANAQINHSNPIHKENIQNKFAIGSNIEDVLKIQRDYSYRKDESNSTMLYFGRSAVEISKATNEVIAWFNWDNNLKVKIKPGKNITDSELIDINSHTDDVIRLHGQPRGIKGERWLYGYSKSYILVSAETNRVKKWNNTGDLKTRDRTFLPWD